MFTLCNEPNPATDGYFPTCGYTWEKEYLPNPINTQLCDDHVFVDVQDTLNDQVLNAKFIAVSPSHNDARKEYFFLDETKGILSIDGCCPLI